MDEKLVLEVAKYIIENKATIKEAAIKFNKSESSIKKYINDKLIDIDEKMYLAVKYVQNELMIEGRKIGGQTGKRGPSITEEEAKDIAKQMIKKAWTYEEAQMNLGIPSSTIYERVNSIKDPEIREGLEELSKKNKEFGCGKR